MKEKRREDPDKFKKEKMTEKMKEKMERDR